MICLSGDLGSGKTTLAQGIGRGWGAGQHVTSPSYTMVNQYPRLSDGRYLYHVDCYRLTTPDEIITVGLDDILDDDGAIMIEWPERILHILPEVRLWVELRTLSETRRGMRMKAEGDRPAELLRQFRLSAFGV